MSIQRMMGPFFIALVAGSTTHAQRPLPSPCSYDTCALSLLPRLRGLDIVRGVTEERVATLGFLVPRSVNDAFAGDALAESHASRALSIRRVASAMTDIGALVAATGAIRAGATAHDRRTSTVISLSGLALVGASVLPQFAADAELSRAVREYNRQFAR